jgi:SAM-dependent methyltransferase
MSADSYYRANLAFVHDRGFGRYPNECAPGVLDLLAPVRGRGGLVHEIGCGSGTLTRHLLVAGHRVLASDASPAMLDLAREAVPGAELRRITLPDDPLPEADAVVGVGHALNYLPDADAVRRALVALARSLRPGGLLAVDLCDLEWGETHTGEPPVVRIEDEWTLVTRFSLPRPDLYVREMTTFRRRPDGLWDRDDERHDNVLLDTAEVPALLAGEGLDAAVVPGFGAEQRPPGLPVILATRPT